jgi:DNA mismatch repair protein MutS2
VKESSGHALRVLEIDRIREVLASYAVSAPGKEAVGRMSPLSDIALVRRRLEETEEMRALLAHERLPLAGVRDVAAGLDAAASGGRPAEPDLLYQVVDLLRTAAAAREAIGRHRTALPNLAEIADAMQDLPSLREEILSKVDPRHGLRDGATEKLAALRAELEALRAALRARAHRILADPRLRTAFQSEGLTVKNDRYLLPVKAEYRSWVHGPVRDRSQSGSTLYVEPDEITLDGDRLLEVLDKERDEVELILWDLTRKALAARATLAAVQEKLAWLDFTAAKAAYAAAFGLTAPEVNEQGILDLRDARHPYLLWLARDLKRGPRDVDLEAVQSRVVPISVRLGETFRILVVTGPNTGGKTVALKTVGLNVLLALSGMPIPAAPGSRVPLYDGVFADIGDEQSIEQSLSTFSSHLKQLIEVVRNAGERSLILLDELGSGTDPLEGAALARALLDRFLARGWQAIITTHIGSLKEYVYSREGAENAAMEFDPRSLRPTYRLLMGIPGSSNALAIARRVGLDPELVDAAEAEVARVREPTREIISRMERSRRQADRERRRAERIRRRAQGDARATEERLREVEAARAAVQEEAQRSVDESVRSVKERLEPILAELRNVPKTHQPAVDRLREAVDSLLAGTPLGARREAFARSLKKEDDVYVPKFRERARVKKVDRGGRVVTVLLNGISMEIGFDDISWIEAPPGG